MSARRGGKRQVQAWLDSGLADRLDARASEAGISRSDALVQAISAWCQSADSGDGSGETGSTAGADAAPGIEPDRELVASMAGQLATKDEQIARRDAQIDRLHALLAQAQQNASAAIEAASRPVAAVGPAGPIEPAARIGTRPAGRIARAWAVLVGRA